MAGKKHIQKHEFSKLDFYRKCKQLMKSKEDDMFETIKYEFEKQLQIEKPFAVFEMDGHQRCISLSDMYLTLENAVKALYG